MYIIDVVDRILKKYDSLDISYATMLAYILSALNDAPADEQADDLDDDPTNDVVDFI